MLSKILCTPSGEESIFGVQITSDGTTAADNFAALQSFFEKFPEYTTNDFYVAGESYGGFYVPTLSLTIFKAGATFKGSMKGFLVGNGVFDGSITSRARIPFLYGHGAVSTELFTKAQQACGANFSGTSKECDDVANTIETLVQGLNPYDFYRDCYLGPEQATLAQSTRVSMFDIDRSPHTALREMVATLPRPAHPAVVAAMRRTAPTSGSMGYHLGLGETAPCIDSHGGIMYLNRRDVKQALHVTESPFNWTICSDYLHYQQDDFVKSHGGMLEIYRTMLKNYRVVVYNVRVLPTTSWWPGANGNLC
eukprot:m.664914 g.664914  ORF g.664914 m.664914 type:complete len:308 (-) comp22747_c0_seq15:2889-3812(-)